MSMQYSPPERSAQIPRRLGIYQLHSRLAAGRWSELFAASPAATSNPDCCDYAVKVLHHDLRDDTLANALLQREAFVGMQVSNPHLISVLDAEFTGRERFLVMPRLHGMTINALMRDTGRLDPPKALWCVRQAAQAVRALHQAGWLHSDLHPENLWVAPSGHVTVLDLGHARRLSGDECKSKLLVMGSLSYAAPETLAADSDIGPPADVFSLGRILYKLLTGTHAEEPVRDVRKIVPTLPTSVSVLLRHLLANQPIRRPSAEELVERLIRCEIETFDQRGLQRAAS